MDHDANRHDDRAIALALCVQDRLGASAGAGVEMLDHRPDVGERVYEKGGLRRVGANHFDRDRAE